MKALALYALEVLACSGVLLAAYAILLERRVRFAWCRAYLLGSTLLAAIIPLLRIPVWPGGVIEAVPTVAMPAEWSAEVVGEATPTLTPEAVCLAVYLLGAALIAGVMLWQAVRIRRLRRGAEITRTDRFTLVRTPQRIASFSFFRSIYVWDQTPVHEMKAIVAHEASHIAHRHSAERIAMECMKAALWWNPFVWIAARRLTEAEEFEADSDVLAGGYDIEDYMKTIFRQLFGYSPEIANGLRDSLTKKRFKMMTTKTPGRYALLRLAGTLPALAGLLCAFSFTTRAAEFRTPEAVEAPADTATKNVRIEVSKDGRPLSGAIILVAGSTKGTVTDAEGNASIDARPGATLLVTYVGCETQKIETPPTDSGSEPIRVAMKAETNDLAPVSVTPGGQKTSAAEAGQGDDLRKIDIQIQLIEIKKDNIDTSRPATGATIKVVGSTKGVVANETGLARINVAEGSVLEILYPGYQRTWLTTNTESYYRIALVPEDAQTNHPKMRIRSEKGMQSEPLYIVDGVEQADIDNLNANEVLSMSVLKDLVSTALYGPRGKNGVIIITTRRSAKPVTEEATFDPATGAIKTADAGRDEPFIIAETMPLFRGGDLNAFRAWAQGQIVYPAEAMKQGIEGRVVVTFVVETDGSVDDIRILQSPDQLLTDEARRVIASSPAGAWTPGQQRGKNVAVKYTLPVDFRLTKTEPAPARDEATFDPATGTIQTAPAGDDEPFLIVETMPSFQGGDILAFRQWVQMQIKYPSEALKEKLYGRVVASFIVEKDGSVSNIEVLQSPGKALADEARRVIGRVPAGAWTPGMQRGQAVRVKYTMPVDFRIQGESGQTPQPAKKTQGNIDEVIVVGYGDPK